MIDLSGVKGAILGDIAGSRIEFYRPADFDYKTSPLFTEECLFTDDTVMTLATKFAIEEQKSFIESYQLLGRKYPDAGYGERFQNWLREDNPTPYNSYGNGSAMRVSYIGVAFKKIEDVEAISALSAVCSHNHIQGIIGAVETARCVWMANNGYSKEKIKLKTEEHSGYDLNMPISTLRPDYRYDVTCQGTVPVAIRCFLESEDYEDCIRNVFSLNGDVDTMACIAGGIAGAFYKNTVENEDEILNAFLDEYLKTILFQKNEKELVCTYD